MASALYDKLMADMKTAMKAHDMKAVNAIRGVVAKAKDLTVNAGKEMTDEAGYWHLCVPKAVDAGETFPCRLETHGYNGNDCTHSTQTWGYANEIVFNINAHGLKLVEFGATEADTKALRWEIRSHDRIFALDPYLKNWARRKEIMSEIERRHGEIRKMSRPVQHAYELRRTN